MMVLGMPVDPEDYLHPWSPNGRIYFAGFDAHRKKAKA